MVVSVYILWKSTQNTHNGKDQLSWFRGTTGVDNNQLQHRLQCLYYFIKTGTEGEGSTMPDEKDEIEELFVYFYTAPNYEMATFERLFNAAMETDRMEELRVCY